jgi:hypothetical protein
MESGAVLLLNSTLVELIGALSAGSASPGETPDNVRTLNLHKSPGRGVE